MENHNDSTIVNDSAGVLPMDTGASVNGSHDDGAKKQGSTDSGGPKKGRGRPPKFAGLAKASKNSDGIKRGRGRPPKANEAPSKKTARSPEGKHESLSNGADENTKKRGRPSKSSTPSEQTNGINKPQIQSGPVSNQRNEEKSDEEYKKKRGRPAGSSLKKPQVAAVPKDVSSGKKRGRPSGSISKKSATKIKPKLNADGSAKKRGRPKKLDHSTKVSEASTNGTPNVASNIG